jgi:hypothetical protein
MCLRMQSAFVLIALALLAVLVSSVWPRRAELEFNGESASMLLGLIFCFVCVLFILFAAA